MQNRLKVIRQYFISVFSFGCIGIAVFQCDSASANELATGIRSKTTQPVAVALDPPSDLNFKRRSEIISARWLALSRYPILLDGQYNPEPAVFGQMEDNKPWWGMNGQFVWGQGDRSIEGASEESRYILNPYLLVGLNSWTAEIWDTDRVKVDDLRQRDFPFCWMPVSLVYWPGQSMAQAVYDVTAFETSLKRHFDRLKDKERTVKFGLVAYNARDMGFRYLYVVPQASNNIVNEKASKEPVEIKQFIHAGGSSGYPGGANNMSPAMPEIDELSFTSLPARVCVSLWRSRPPSVTTPPDMVYLIELR